MFKSFMKLQFSKQLCVYSWGLLSLTIALEFVLQWTNRGSMSDIAIALVSFATVFINGGYITQNIFRDTSLNNNGLVVGETGIKNYIDKNNNKKEDKEI